MTSTFYPPFHIGGDANHVKYLAEELAGLTHEVHVFYNMDAFVVKKRSSLRPLDSQGSVLKHAYESRSNLSPYVTYLLGNSQGILKAYESLVRQIEPQVVHHHNISLLGYGIINRFGSYANIYTAHDYWLICPQNNLLRNGDRECSNSACITCALKRARPPQFWRRCNDFRETIDKIDLIIAPSTYLQRKLLDELSVRSLVIRNFAPPPPPHIYKQNLSDYYLFVGSLEEHKGILNLLEVFRESGKEIGTKLIVVGRGKLEDSIKNFVQEHSLHDSVIFRGAVDDEELYSLYSNARALVIPSIWPENAPLVALEALSVGTPVIASNTGGLPEIIGIVNERLIFKDSLELKKLLINFRKDVLTSIKARDAYEKYFSPKAYLESYFEAINGISG
jgi:glycosyltransferase involved in cell wall biosynthesis